MALIEASPPSLTLLVSPVTQPMHYAAIESNRELDKSLKVFAWLLLIFGPNMIILFLNGVKP